MKKTFLSIILIFFQFFSLGISVFAEDNKGLKDNEILVSERPLGAKNCKCAKTESDSTDPAKRKIIIEGETDTNGEIMTCKAPVEKRLYVCETTSLNSMIQGIVAFIIQIAILLGVLATAILGVAWAIAGADNPEYKKKLKEWLVGLIIGLIIIYGFQYILGIFGWIYKPSV